MSEFEELTSTNQSKKVAFFTLGCKLNFAETSTIARLFADKGYKKVPFSADADVYVINTCSVTRMADKKCRQAINKAASNGGRVVVIGCYSQLNPDEIAAISGVDLILGTKEKFNILSHLEALSNGQSQRICSCNIAAVNSFEYSFSSDDRTRAFLKIQDGCDYHCTYCTIPLARGKSRNDTIEATIKQAHQIAKNGYHEIVLTGVNIGDFGQSTNETFFDLIQQLDQIEGINRYRISSIEPNLLTSEIIQFCANSQRFLPHFHIPLQSGSNRILALMSRRYKRELFAQRIEQIRQLSPNACIGADVIVGFPGETDEDFADTLDFIKNLDINYLHVFPYSERPNTKAIGFDGKVSPKQKELRSKALIELSERKRLLFYTQQLGKQEQVLFETSITKGMMSGFTRNYIRVEVPVIKHIPGTIVTVQLNSINSNGHVTGIISE